MFSLILGVLPLHNGSLALNERVQSVLSLSHPVWIFLQRLFLSLFPEPPETSGLISPVRAYSGAYYSHACVLSHVQLFVTPWTVAHQGPPSIEFSRQEYWKCEVKVTQSCLTLCDPMDYIYSPWNSPGQNTGVLEWVAFPFSRASSQPRDRTHVSCFSCIGRHILFTIAPPVDPLYYSQ